MKTKRIVPTKDLEYLRNHGSFPKKLTESQQLKNREILHGLKFQAMDDIQNLCLELTYIQEDMDVLSNYKI